MKPQIFFLIFAVSTSLLFGQQVYATHYSDVGIDDAFYWREHDVDPIDSVFCTFNGIMEAPFDDDRISLQCRHGSYDGETRRGGLYIIKVFDKDQIYNGTTNVFSWRFDNTCSEASCNTIRWAVMDGAYDYTSLSEGGGFANNIDYISTQLVDCGGATYDWAHAPTSYYLCFGQATGNDLDNILGAGNLDELGTKGTFTLPSDNTSTKGDQTKTISLDNTDWAESTQSQITVFLMLDAGDAAGGGGGTNPTNHMLQPLSFSITNTDQGTMTWNFPETTSEATLWEAYTGGSYYETNGTNADYGYFFSFDQTVPDPPTNLYAVENISNIRLYWTSPVFDGYDPIIGYKIERESPVGGGFTTLVSNTGDVITTYTDTSITPGQEYNYRVRALNSFGESLPSNESKDGTASNLNPNVDCSGNTTDFLLYDKGISTTTATLCWNGVILNQTALLGYQINFTTPWGDPLTTVTGLNNTGDNATTRLIENLTPATKYSFRVQSWMNGSMNNVTQILNVTTLPGELELDDFDITSQDNPYRWPWGFNQVDLGNNYTSLLVSYPTGTNATCIFDFQFARNNQTFSNISTVASGDGLDVANFTLQNPQNEVIYVTCYDEDDPDSEGRTIIRQTTFPLLTQIEGFRTGEYGTMGNFGIFDLVTFVVVIISMIGFNRVNSAVAVAFSFIVIFVSAAFGFIEPISSIMMGLVVIGVGFGIFMHHRNEASP